LPDAAKVIGTKRSIVSKVTDAVFYCRYRQLYFYTLVSRHGLSTAKATAKWRAIVVFMFFLLFILRLGSGVIANRFGTIRTGHAGQKKYINRKK
jgi:hypothetical protein